MVDIKRGKTEKFATSELLVKFFESHTEYEGKLYIGYPILYTGGESIILDAVWVSEKYGVIVFDLIEGIKNENREEQRDALYTKLSSLLSQYIELNTKRVLQVPVEVFTFAPASKKEDYVDTAFAAEELQFLIQQRDVWTNAAEYYNKTISVIQSVIQLKAKANRTYVKKVDSKGAIIKKLEETIANLDNQQEAAIIEYTDGLQRIRGLAGSGKTIVLALKAAYLHAINPDWKIAVTFNTRALKNQFYELIELFCIQKIGRKPDEEKIKILQAWGGSTNAGIYHEFCKSNGIEYLDFRAAIYYQKQKGLDKKQIIDVVCTKALEETKGKEIVPMYDAILVDEAQDLSESFLNLCYKILTPKKRLIYAYDELQKLNEGFSLRNPKNIFGAEASDIILRKCYRNSRPVLVTAHALGFGIYRKEGLAQFFDQPQLWKDVGYNIKNSDLTPGKQAVLYRPDEATDKFIENAVPIDDLISFESFADKESQAKKLCKEIIKNLKEDELLTKDIIVINPMSLTTRDEVALARTILEENKIKSHIAGDANPDIFYEKDSIAFTGINRAKGNEVAMVYIINAENCFSHPFLKDRDLISRRNILFTAITRSKAWVRVYGIGKNMDRLIEEFNEVKKKHFVLDFIYPTKPQIEKMNVVRRDISKEEEVLFKEEVEGLFGIPKIIERIKKKEAYIEDYPEELREILRKLIDEK